MLRPKPVVEATSHRPGDATAKIIDSEQQIPTDRGPCQAAPQRGLGRSGSFSWHAFSDRLRDLVVTPSPVPDEVQ